MTVNFKFYSLILLGLLGLFFLAFVVLVPIFNAAHPFIIVNLTNTQAISTPVNLTQMLKINTTNSLFSPYVNSDLGNIRFYYSTNALYSWCESNCTNRSSDAIFWVRIPFAIGANSGSNIIMSFNSMSTQYDGVYAGEAPELSPYYAEWDNGNLVFSTLYTNFKGTSIPAGYAVSGNVIINNGIIVSGSGENEIRNFNFLGANSSQILDFYGEFTDVGSTGEIEQGGWIYNGDARIQVLWSTGNVTCNMGNTLTLYSNGVCDSSFSAFGSNNVFSIYYPNSSKQIGYINYNDVTSISGNPTQGGGIGFAMQNHQGINSGPYYWVRLRPYPPGGVMPSVKFTPHSVFHV